MDDGWIDRQTDRQIDKIDRDRKEINRKIDT